MAGVQQNLNHNSSDLFLLSKEEMQEFKNDYMKHGKFNLEVQVPHLEKLAERYFNRYKEGRCWMDAIKAHSLYNSLSYREPTCANWEQKGFEVQQAYWGGESTLTFSDIQNNATSIRNKLHQVRSHLKKELEPVESLVSQDTSSEQSGFDSFINDFCDLMETTSRVSTDRMVDVAEEVFRNSVNSLKQRPPCAFVVVALGSMARGEATPYSDLEYVFLVEQKDAEIESYFEKLAITSYFNIGNVGETKLNNMGMCELNGWFDDKQKNGFKIDGLAEQAGNIPTGNGHSKKNCFIATPDGLLSQYSMVLANPVNKESRRGDLTSLLQYTHPIFQYGATAAHLLEHFTSQKQIMASNQSKQRIKANKEMFQADAQKYNFRPETHVIEHAYSINSKKELYRYPSILLFNLSILIGICESDSWQTLRSIFIKKQISQSLHTSLKFLLACSCYVRLSAYLYHDSQDDRLSVLPKSLTPLHSVTSEAGKRWYLTKSLFLRICENSVPLKEHISKCTFTDVLELIKKDLDPPTWLTKFETFFCCHRWLDSWQEFRNHFSDRELAEKTEETISDLRYLVHNDMNQLWHAVSALGYVLFQQRKYKEALKLYNTFLHMSFNSAATLENDLQRISAASSDQIALGLVYLDKHSDALEEYEKALDLRSRTLDSNHELLAYSHFFIGRCSKHMNDYDKAEVHLVKAMHMYHHHASRVIVYDYYGDSLPHTGTVPSLEHIISADAILQYLNNSSIMLGNVLWHLGTIYFALKWYQRALNYFKKTELMHIELYGSEAHHKNTSATHYYISQCYIKLGDLSNGVKYFHMAGSAIIEIFGTQFTDEYNHAAKQCLNGQAERRLYCEAARNIFHRLPGYRELHAENGEIIMNGGIFFSYMEQHDLANETLDEAVYIYTSIPSSALYSKEIGVVKSAQGLNHWRSGNLMSAVQKFKEALDILHLIERPSAQLEAAETLQNMGLMYAEVNDWEVARSYLAEAQELYNQHCGDSSHPKLAEIENQFRELELQ